MSFFLDASQSLSHLPRIHDISIPVDIFHALFDPHIPLFTLTTYTNPLSSLLFHPLPSLFTSIFFPSVFSSSLSYTPYFSSFHSSFLFLFSPLPFLLFPFSSSLSSLLFPSLQFISSFFTSLLFSFLSFPCLPTSSFFILFSSSPLCTPCHSTPSRRHNDFHQSRLRWLPR